MGLEENGKNSIGLLGHFEMEMEEHRDPSDEWEIDDTLLGNAGVSNPLRADASSNDSSTSSSHEFQSTSFIRITLADLDKNQRTSRTLPYTRIGK